MNSYHVIAQFHARALKRQPLISIEIREYFKLEPISGKLRSAVKRSLVVESVVDPQAPAGGRPMAFLSVHGHRE
jgi:hypothetical protein